MDFKETLRGSMKNAIFSRFLLNTEKPAAIFGFGLNSLWYESLISTFWTTKHLLKFELIAV